MSWSCSPEPEIQSVEYLVLTGTTLRYVMNVFFMCLPGQDEKRSFPERLHEHQTQSNEGRQEEKRDSETNTTTLLISHTSSDHFHNYAHYLCIKRRDVLVACLEKNIITMGFSLSVKITLVVSTQQKAAVSFAAVAVKKTINENCKWLFWFSLLPVPLPHCLCLFHTHAHAHTHTHTHL